MKTYRHDDKELLDILSGFFLDGSLVPVFGAGFTVGEKAISGETVPSGSEFREIMLNCLADHGFTDEDIEELKSNSFSEISENFFDSEVIPVDISKNIVKKCFLDVSLSNDKKALLNDIDWKYIFTLNIDNAIEKNSKFRPIYPYDSGLSNDSREYKPLYKLHGDVYYEVTHDTNRLVFRKSSYIQSIKTNSRMLELFQLDLLHKNIVYFGCSLEDEDDIAFISARKTHSDQDKTLRIIFRTEEVGRVERAKLKRHGINTVILTDKGEYDQAYKLMQKAYSNSAVKDNSLEKFNSNVIYIGNDPSENKDFLVKGVAKIGSNYTSGSQTLPYYYVERDIESDIIESQYNSSVTILTGPRVSGKTLLLTSISGKIKDKRVFFVGSGVELENHFINKLLGLPSSLIMFDAKTLGVEQCNIIKNQSSALLANKTSVVCVFDTEDANLAERLASRSSSTKIISLDRVFTDIELRKVNQNLKKVRCPVFKSKTKLLDNLFVVFQILGQGNIFNKVPKEKNFFALLYVISVERKLDGDWVQYLNADDNVISEYVDSCSPYLEYEKVNVSEVASHSGCRVICNSNAWLLSVINVLYHARGIDWCVDSLIELVKSIPEQERRFIKRITLFDSLNFAFSGKSAGASDVIIPFYEKLEEVLGSESEFFVQKGKAYYNMYADKDVVAKLSRCIEQLNVALTWAEDDNLHAEKSNTIRNIKHTSALLSLKRSYNDSYQDSDKVIETIDKVYSILVDNDNNMAYVSKLEDGTVKGSKYLNSLISAIDKGKLPAIKMLKAKDKLDYIKSRINA